MRSVCRTTWIKSFRSEFLGTKFAAPNANASTARFSEPRAVTTIEGIVGKRSNDLLDQFLPVHLRHPEIGDN